MIENLYEDLSVHLYEGEPITKKAPTPPPITYLTQWKIVGNSEVHDNEIWSCGEPRTNSITLYDSTKELSDGFLPQSGSYPTTNSNYPNAKYYVFNVKAGYIVRTYGYTMGQIRLRLIDNNVVINDINTTSTTYYTSSWDAFGSKNGAINIEKDCQIGILILDSNVSYEGGSVVALGTQYHILVQPLGGSIADIVLTEPLRKVNNVADTIEFPSGTEGKALVTRPLKEVNITSYPSGMTKVANSDLYRISFYNITDKKLNRNILMAEYTQSKNPYSGQDKGLSCSLTAQNISLYDERFNQSDSNAAFREYLQDAKLIYELDTPTTELVDAPQIQEAESYTCVISQGGKAVSWSSFETNNE